MQDQRTHGEPGTDHVLRRLLRDGGTDVESARLWLQQALGCLDSPLDGFSVGNASNVIAKALVALGDRDARERPSAELVAAARAVVREWTAADLGPIRWGALEDLAHALGDDT